MSKYYLMAQKIPNNGTVIRKMSHSRTRLKTGGFLPSGFQPPLCCQLLGKFSGGTMSTFYQSPAVIGTKRFYQDLLDCGVDNMEVQPVVITDTVKNITFDNYLLLNIIGKVACADLEKSEYTEIGEGMNTVDKLVIDGVKTNGLLLFLLAEDTDCIVIHEQVYNHLQSKGYTDIYFEELEQV
ncbi:MAG: hypothetical protein ACI82Q_002793 [Nonlabens sp.]|jgi:hypothetical protein